MFSSGSFSTVAAKSEHFQPVPIHEEALLIRNAIQNRFDLLILKLFQFATLATDEMIVLWVAVVVFPDFAAVRPRHLADQTRRLHRLEGAVNGRSADPFSATDTETFRQIFGIKVLVTIEDLVDDDFPFWRQPHLLRGEIFAELLFRTRGDGYGA